MVNCSCGDKKCNAHLSIGNVSGNAVHVELENGPRYATMYLDANGLIELIHEAKRVLKELADAE
jgi:hypothetical protein